MITKPSACLLFYMTSRGLSSCQGQIGVVEECLAIKKLTLLFHIWQKEVKRFISNGS